MSDSNLSMDIPDLPNFDPQGVPKGVTATDLSFHVVNLGIGLGVKAIADKMNKYAAESSIKTLSVYFGAGAGAGAGAVKVIGGGWEVL
ncbi:MAG: hypothetical protein JKY94_13675 [Rhodobacteraceae bacterium]|nr:hypothetical protein [Paracoccaceae bacterium]